MVNKKYIFCLNIWSTFCGDLPRTIYILSCTTVLRSRTGSLSLRIRLGRNRLKTSLRSSGTWWSSPVLQHISATPIHANFDGTKDSRLPKHHLTSYQTQLEVWRQIKTDKDSSMSTQAHSTNNKRSDNISEERQDHGRTTRLMMVVPHT